MNPGLVAVGDSIVNGHGDSMAGVPALSWAQWLADAMDLSYTRYARGGATSSEIVADLLPRVRGRYAVGVFNMGTNDALKGLEVDLFESNVRTTAKTLADVCNRVVVLTVPISAEATRVIEKVAAETGAIVVDSTVRSLRLLTPDGVHPTTLGHLAIADRAAIALGAPLPSALARNGGRGRLGAAYRFRYAVGVARSAAKQAVKRAIRTTTPVR